MKIAICDDDNSLCNTLKDMIKTSFNKCMIDIYNSGETLEKSKKNYTLIFLDIGMDGINGIETGKRIRVWDKQVKIVYITSFSDYRAYAFSVHAFEYLEKPISQKEVLRIINEVNEYDVCLSSPIKLEFLTEEGIVRLEPEKILYFEYSDRKVILNTEHETYSLRKRLSEISEMMRPYAFAVPHKSFCINFFHVRNIKRYDIYMTNGAVVPLSQKKSAYFREQLNIYLEHLIG